MFYAQSNSAVISGQTGKRACIHTCINIQTYIATSYFLSKEMSTTNKTVETVRALLSQEIPEAIGYTKAMHFQRTDQSPISAVTQPIRHKCPSTTAITQARRRAPGDEGSQRQMAARARLSESAAHLCGYSSPATGPC